MPNDVSGIFGNDIVERFREQDISLDKVKKKLNKAEKSDEGLTVSKPDRDRLDVFDKPIKVDEDKDISEMGNVYINGCSVHPMYGKIANMLYNGKSPVLYVVGDPRMGKSKTAGVIAWLLHNKLNLLHGSFNPRNQLLFNETEFILAKLAFKRMALFCDEAHEYLNTKERWSDFVKNVEGAIRTQAIRENVYIIVTTQYKRIAPQIRENIDFMIDMKQRQFADVTRYDMKNGKVSNRGSNYNFIQYPRYSVEKLPEKQLDMYERVENQFKGDYILNLASSTIDKKIEEAKEKQVRQL